MPPAEISVLDPDGNELTDGAGGLDFPLTVTGGSRPFTVTIWNLGASDLASLSVRIAGPDAGDFTEEVGGMATTLNPLTSTTFTVTFSPTTPGAKTASLTIASNDADENPFDIALSGDAIAPPPATLLVESSGDTDDGNYGPGNLSLREAIILANLLPDATTINFDSGPITLGSALPAIATETSIVGFGAVSNIVDGGGSARVFTVDDGNAGMAIPVTISGLTIRNGLGAPGENGGGIFNAEMLTISECVIADNHARGPGNEGSPFGGGIYSTGSLFVERSTISGNVCDSVGGGIFAAGPIATIWNSTVSGNSAATAGGVAIAGLSGPIDAHILNSTLVENTGGSQLFGGPFGGLTVFGANAILDNSIVAGNSEDGAPGDIVVQSGGTLAGFNNLVGHLGTAGGLEHGTDGNILGNGSGGLRALGAIVGPLSNLGGGTTVRPLVSGSPAIDHGDNIKAADLTTDQRGTGFDRVVGGTVDIGAFERGAGTGGGNTPPSVTLTGANPLTFEAASQVHRPRRHRL